MVRLDRPISIPCDSVAQTPTGLFPTGTGTRFADLTGTNVIVMSIAMSTAKPTPDF